MAGKWTLPSHIWNDTIHITPHTTHFMLKDPVPFCILPSRLFSSVPLMYVVLVLNLTALWRVCDPGQHTSGVTAQVVGGSECACSTGFLQARFCVRTSVDNFYARSQNGEKRLLASIITVCLPARNSVPTGRIFHEIYLRIPSNTFRENSSFTKIWQE